MFEISVICSWLKLLSLANKYHPMTTVVMMTEADDNEYDRHEHDHNHDHDTGDDDTLQSRWEAMPADQH